MKIITKIPLKDFRFWGGAKDTAAELTTKQFKQLENILSDAYPNGISEVQLNNLFWNERSKIMSWLGVNAFPKWAVFKSKFDNWRVVEVQDEADEEQLIHWLNACDSKANWYKDYSEIPCDDVSGLHIGMNDCSDIQELIWEEDNAKLKFTLRLPMNWAADYENGEFSGDDEEERCYNEFLKDYEEELTDHEKWFYAWDIDRIEFCSHPDYGEPCNCCTLRIYSKQ